MIDRAGGFIVSGDPYNGIVLPGNGSAARPKATAFRSCTPASSIGSSTACPKGSRQTHWTVFQPRIGLAYGLNSKTSMRAGLGMFANRTAINRDTALGGNAPFQPQQIVINGSADAPAGAVPRAVPVHDDHPGPGLQDSDCLELERHRPARTAGQDHYRSRLRRAARHSQSAQAQHQPIAARDHPGESRRQRQRAAPVSSGMGILGLAENSGLSMYNGLQISAQRRFAHGFPVRRRLHAFAAARRRFVADRDPAECV